MEAERRVMRSEDPSRAIRIFLAKNAGEPGVRAAVVASDDGLLLGGVGNEDLDALAAVGTSLRCGRDVSRHCAQLGWSERALFTSRIEAGGNSFTVASVGGPLSKSQEVGALLERLLA